MSKSLQDQLKALGLAKETAPRPVPKKNQKPNPGPTQHATRRNDKPLQAGSKHNQPWQAQPGQARPVQAQPRQQGSHPPGKLELPTADSSKLTLEQAYILREQQSRTEAEAAKESKRLADLKRRQINNAIKAIVQPYRLNDPAAELARHFIYKERIRKVNVTLEQFKAINAGQLGLVYLSGGYHVLSSKHVDQVRMLSLEHVPDLSGGAQSDQQVPVPDDLIW